MILLYIISICLTVLIEKSLIKWAPKMGLLDKPNERSSHIKITPRGGGIAFVCVVVIVLASLRVSGYFPILTNPRQGLFLLCWCIVAAISLWDDFRSLNAGVRLMVHIVAAAGIVLSIGRFDVTLPCSVNPACQIIIEYTITVLWIVWLINIYNFMDGLDGIAAMQGIIASAGWCLFSNRFGGGATGWIAAVLGGTCSGFLFFNWSPAKIFMGDVGSAFLGCGFASLPLFAHSSAISKGNGYTNTELMVFAVTSIWPFVADSTITLIIRAIRGEQLWKAHRSHWYQRMAQKGLSHSNVAVYYGVFAAVCAVGGMAFLVTKSWMYAITPAILFVVVTFVLVRRLER